MSVEIPVSYVEQFSANVHMLSEQRMSRLRNTVTDEEVTGESAAVERIGTTQDTPEKITTLHGDTPLSNTEHSRRWLYITGYDVADLIDKQSRVRMLINPDGAYTIRHAGTMGRGMDDAIITALGGSANEGKNGATSVALPSAQKISANSSGLTLAKLVEVKELLDAAEVDEFIDRFLVVSAKQITNLLNDDKVTSADYNTVKALVQGNIDEFMGFRFIRSERLPTSGSDRLCYGFTRTAVRFGLPVPPSSVASERPDKRHAKQIYTYGEWGAVRTEDEMVVEVACTEN